MAPQLDSEIDYIAGHFYLNGKYNKKEHECSTKTQSYCAQDCQTVALHQSFRESSVEFSFSSCTCMYFVLQNLHSKRKKLVCSDSPSRYVRATNLRISSMRMTGKESFSTMIHCSVFKCVSLKIICGPKRNGNTRESRRQKKNTLGYNAIRRRKGDLAPYVCFFALHLYQARPAGGEWRL